MASTRRILLPVVANCALAMMVRAQEAMDTDLQPQPSPARTKTPVAAPATPAPTPPDISSAAAPNVPELSQLDEAFKRTSLGKEADDRRLHLQWRQLANRVANDPEVAAAKKSAASARTDLEKRNRLRDYYNIYYGKMRALAGSSELKTALDQLKMAHLSQINQPRVRAETDAALPTPSPSPRKHHQ